MLFRSERRFQLADHVQVQSADYENGLLHIELQRIIPEAMKPRQIPIGNSFSSDNLTHVTTGVAANTETSSAAA